MSLEMINLFVLIGAIVITGVALVLTGLQLSKINTRVKDLEKELESFIKHKTIQKDVEKEVQITYKEAIKRLREGESPESISSETGVSLRELLALAKLLERVN